MKTLWQRGKCLCYHAELISLRAYDTNTRKHTGMLRKQDGEELRLNASRACVDWEGGIGVGLFALYF